MSAVDVLPLSPPATASGSRKQARPLFALKQTASTPDDSPESGPEFSSLGSRKKVEFSPWADIHHPSALVTTLLESTVVKSLPPSRECQSYIKSILKSSIQDEKRSPGFDGPADEKVSLNEVMESIVQQLSKNETTESIDAYQTLTSTIKAYDEIPDQAVLKNKLTAIARQIRQHLGAKERLEHEPGDTNLVTSALKVLVILVWNAEFEALLSDDFRAFILDRSISVIAEHTAPKSVLVHYLHLLATQDFRPGLLTSNGRASRLIEALEGLTEHVKGNGAVSERLLVYQRLLDQARSVMKSRSTQWAEHMLTAMASNIADTRNKALALGRKACQAFPASSSISGPVRMALDLKQETGRTLGVSICRRLEKMVMGKDDAVQVPQIWAVILLLCNDLSMRIDSWQGLREWLMVIQRCFNSSDTSLRLQTNSAWNRFVYIARPHEGSDSLVAMLSKPVAAQLERSANDKSSKESHIVAMSSYCNLLYYAFRPATTLSQYDRIWNEYVVKVMRSSLFEKRPGNADIASRILMTLFWDAKKTTKVWNENRAHENRLVEPEELPTIDCKWTRSRCLPILEIFQVLFRHCSWGLPGSQDQAYAAKAWRHFLKAIREAGSKEIKMSNETRAAGVSILKFLTKLWHQQDDPGKSHAGESIHLKKEVLTNISSAAVNELGVEHVLDLIETELVSYSPSLLLVIFEILKSELETDSRPHPLILRLVGNINDSLEMRYQCRSAAVDGENHALLETVSRLLSSLPHAMAEDVLKTLNSGLAVWLHDKDAYFSPSANIEYEQSEQTAAVLKRFVDAFATALCLFPPASIGALDASLAAAFASPHSTFVNAIIETWNKTFGVNDEVEIGPQLTDAIKRLLPYVELVLPPSWVTDGDVEASLPAAVFETQVESGPDRALEPLTKRSADGVKGIAVQGVEEVAATTTVEKMDEIHQCKERRVEPPISSRKRHDDSQLHFVAIESSPPGAAAEDSQFLTSNQKEVRDRQREEPAITFTDLRSSPRPQSRHSESRDCGFARRAATMHDRPTTPILPEHHDPTDAHAEASPTPKSRLLRKVSEVDIPSSPPSMQGVPSSSPKQAEASAATPPHRSSSVFNTDNLNELSASQLSHDLDWSTVLEGLDTPPTASKSPAPHRSPMTSTQTVRPSSAVAGEVEVSTEHVDEEAVHMNEADAKRSQASQKKRKRPQSGYAERTRKRRKPPCLQSQSTSSQVSCFKREEEEELLDCIVVDTSSECLGSSSALHQNGEQADGYVVSQLMEIDQDESVIVRGGGKPRGRPRKSQSQSKEELTRSGRGPEEVLQELSPIRHKQRSRSSRRSRNRMSLEVSAEAEPRGAQGTPYVLIPSVEVTAPNSDAKPQDEVVATLEAALNQLKTAAPGSIDLRAVDELCFQIRYQAQKAANG